MQSFDEISKVELDEIIVHSEWYWHKKPVGLGVRISVRQSRQAG
jgi:hypothetical protein